jgi:hypothetical protein
MAMAASGRRQAAQHQRAQAAQGIGEQDVPTTAAGNAHSRTGRARTAGGLHRIAVQPAPFGGFDEQHHAGPEQQREQRAHLAFEQQERKREPRIGAGFDAGQGGEKLASVGPQNPVMLIVRMPSTAMPRTKSIAAIREGSPRDGDAGKRTGPKRDPSKPYGFITRHAMPPALRPSHALSASACPA